VAAERNIMAGPKDDHERTMAFAEIAFGQFAEVGDGLPIAFEGDTPFPADDPFREVTV